MTLLLRLLLLFFVPLVAFGFLFLPGDRGIGPAMVAYVVLLLGAGIFAAAALSKETLVRVLLTIGLAIGMFLLHLFAAFAGCMAMVSIH